MMDPKDFPPEFVALKAYRDRPDLSLVEHLEFIVGEIDADPETATSPRLHWVGIYLLRLIARERGLT